MNRYLYQPEETRLSAEETDLELMVDGIRLRGWEVNPGQKHALVYYGGNGEGLDWLVELLSSNFPTTRPTSSRTAGTARARARRRVRRLVLITPFDSVAALAAEDWGYHPRLAVRLVLRGWWDSAAVAHRVRAPVLVVRAGRDRVVFPAATGRLLAALPGAPQVLNSSRRSHATVDADPAFWPAIVEFFAP